MVTWIAPVKLPNLTRVLTTIVTGAMADDDADLCCPIGGRVATTGGGGDDGGEPAAKRQRGRRGGRKTGNQKDVARRASASRDPV